MGVDAACRVVGTAPPDGGYIIVCDETDTAGITCGDFGDIITIAPGASVTRTDAQSAAETATVSAVALDAGNGGNLVTNNGSVSAQADADALPAPGKPSRAAADATAVRGGNGADDVQNSSALSSTVTADSTSGSISLTLEGDVQSQCTTSSGATATGIDGETGDNRITNAGGITVSATSRADAPSVQLDLTGTARADASVSAQATGVGILGQGSIFDQPTGTLSVIVTSHADSDNMTANVGGSAQADVSTTAEAAASGIVGSMGNDSITSFSAITVDATSQADGYVDLDGDTDGAIDAAIEATSLAVGIDGKGGDDALANLSDISAASHATAQAEAASASVWAPGFMDMTVKSHSLSIGMLGGSGRDTISTLGRITANAQATTRSLGLLASLGIEVALSTDIEGATSSEATAKGIDGNDGSDGIMNSSTITATSNADSDADSVLLTLAGIGTFATPTTAMSRSAGIDGGTGADTIDNYSRVDAAATSTADALSVSISGLQLEVASDGDAKTSATSVSAGIAGGEGGDRIGNTATLTSSANSSAMTVDVSVEYMGASVGNSSTSSSATAAGILGEAGSDNVSNSDAITVRATSETDSLAIDVKRNDIPTDPIEWFGADLGDAKTEALADVAGVDGGKDDDTLANSGTIDVLAHAETDSRDIVAEVAIGSGSGSGEAKSQGLTAVVPSALSAAAVTGGASAAAGQAGEEEDDALADAGTVARSNALGMGGGSGNDSLTNSRTVLAEAQAEADSLSIGATVSYERSEFLDILGAISLSDTSTTARAIAAGMDGGTGDDVIASAGTLSATAGASAATVLVKAHFQGDFTEEKGASVEYEIGTALIESKADATAEASGISGGYGNDTIANSGRLTAGSTADAASTGVSTILIGAGKGLVAGASYVNAETTSDADASGIDGGDGTDTIVNMGTGTIVVTAEPSSSSASVGVTLTGVTKGAGISAGAALTDGTTDTASRAAGIRAGQGDDSVTNAGTITVSSSPDADSASVSVTVGAALGETGLVGGFSYADAATTAQATVIGIDGGEGSETVTNSGSITVTASPTASSASVGVTAQGVKGMGAAAGISVTDGTTKAIASATGMAGSSGDDTLTNSGSITVNALPDADSASVSVSLSAAKEGVAAGGTFADATTTAEATAAGTEGGAGNDTIGNSGTIEVTADAESSSASVGVSAAGTMTGVGLGVALADGTTKAVSNAAGITGGEGADTITNSRTITASSTADIAGASVTLNLGGAETGLVLGVAAADISSTADSTASGIEAGSGVDTVVNFGDLTTSALSTISAASVSVNAGVAVNGVAAGAALADGTTTAVSRATGLVGGLGTDTLINLGDNEVSATSEVHAASVAVDIEGTSAGLAAGASLTDGESTASAFAAGIGGGEGDDAIGNYHTTSAAAVTTSTRTSVSVTGTFSLYGVALGAALADAANTSAAEARGIDGSAGDDTVTNGSGLTADASTTASTTSVAVSIDVAVFGVGAGASMTNAETTGSALATGITGGAGNDVIENTADGAITATTSAIAGARAVSVSVAHASLTTAEAATEATAGSTGITGGDGRDSILNRGAINLSANSDTDATAAAAQLIGYGDAEAGAVSTACATGIDGSGGDDTLTNAATGTITNFATDTVTQAAHATADASSYNIQLAGGANATAGTTATASAVGIAGGSGTDIVRNDGAIDLSTEATLVSSSRSVQIMGVGFADAHSDATARVIGIDGGEGGDTMTNSSSGSIAVSSSADATATGVSATIGITGVSAATTSYARSTGIGGGNKKDTVYNHGAIQATTSSSTTAAGGSFSLAGLSSGDSLTQAHALGIDTGDGDDTIVNSGTIEAGCLENADPPLAYSEVASVSFSFFGISSASFGSSAWATGISGGNGDDAILNTGTVTVGDQDWMAEGQALGFTGNFFGFFEMASVGARADTVSAGIDGGDGSDTILNDTGGALGVLATSYAESEGSGDTTFGSTAAFASSTTHATGTGINGSNGDDAIGNRGTITVGADTLAHSDAHAEAGWGSPRSDAAATATATASGIDAGAGLNLVVNEGEIHADSSAVATPVSHADSDIGVTDAESSAQVHAAASGVLSGDEGSTVTNQASGTIDVTASAGTDDGLGTLLRASGDEEATVIAGNANSPITAYATGIALGAGADYVTNDGTITAGASSSPIAQASTNSWPNHATSTATTYSSAVAKGIAAGGGANVITNTGRIDISAWGHGNPIVDAWSRDDTADAHATADAKAAATGIEGQGSILNASTGDIEVNARATCYADADNEAEDTTAAAGLTASAAGISVDTGTLDAGQEDFVRNDGSLTVRALAGEDEDGQPQNILYANGVLWVRSNQAAGTGTVNVDAAGIRTGSRDAHIMNTGTLDVLAREHANLNVRAFSEDYTNHANADSIGNAAATGIRGEDGRYLILNTEQGNVVVGAEANAAANSISDTDGPRFATATSTATAVAQADGMLVGEGANTITNAGAIDVVSSAFSDTDSLADAGTSSHGTATSTSTSDADASGIRTGSGKSRIVNSGAITAEAFAGADAYAYSDDDGWGSDEEISIATATASAQAYGILTGDGDSVVTNTGTIIVSAETEASAVNDTEDYGRSAGTRQMSETAIGIRTGSGNDTITNNGTIISTRIRNGVTSSGLAMATGAGNDTVILGEGSHTSGGIDLGDGDDTLKFVGQSAVNSAIDPGTGSDSLVFEGTGNLDCTFAGFENARKDGPGVFALESLPTMNRLELNGGTLRIDSDYAMAEGSVFRTTVSGDGGFGQLRVTGTAALAGNLTVVKGTGPFLDATTYDIITADAVSDAFDTVMLPAANNFVSFEVHESPTLIQVETNVRDFTWLAGNPVERSVAGYLDRILPDATGEISVILARIQGLSEPEFAKALSSLSSDTYDALTAASISLVGQHKSSLQSRMNRVRSYQYAGRSDQEKPILLAYAGSNPGQFLNPEKISQLQGKSGLWFDAARQWGDQDGVDGFTGYDFSLDGATLGFDHQVGDGLMAGISIGCSKADVDFDHQQGDGSIKSRIGSVYGSYFSGNLSIDAALSYGRSGYDSHRLITVGQLQERASSDHDGDLFSAYLKTGCHHEFNSWFLGPFASLQYISLDEESFTEEGAGSLNLKVDGRRSSALVSEFGLCLARVIEVKYGTLVPELTASWLHDFDIDDRMITSSFAGSPGTAFSIRGTNAEKNGATLGAGATFIHQNGISTSLQYRGERRESCTSQGVMGEIRYAF